MSYTYDNLAYTVARLEACVHCFQSSLTFSTYRYNSKRFSSLHATHKNMQHSLQQLPASMTQASTLGREALIAPFSKCHSFLQEDIPETNPLPSKSQLPLMGRCLIRGVTGTHKLESQTAAWKMRFGYSTSIITQGGLLATI